MKFKAANVIFDIHDLEGSNFGKRYYFHDNLVELANLVTNEDKGHIGTLMEISSNSRLFPFAVKVDGEVLWTSLLYPVEEETEPEKHTPVYRPFTDSGEFIKTYCKRVCDNPNKRPPYTMPLIWLKYKSGNTRELVTAFCDEGVEVSKAYMTWGYLVDTMVFLDNSPCGVEI